MQLENKHRTFYPGTVFAMFVHQNYVVHMLLCIPKMVKHNRSKENAIIIGVTSRCQTAKEFYVKSYFLRHLWMQSFRKSWEPAVDKLKEPVLDQITRALVERYGLNFTRKDISSLWFLCKQVSRYPISGCC